MKKIVLIGPVYPYKGGISHYTGLLYRTLSEIYETTMVSYKMQYPKFLFKKEQRDYSNDRFKIEDTKFWLHTANPFNIMATAGKINKLHPDLVIIQWWHPYFAPCYWILTKLLRNTKILFVCHNVFPHERFPMDHMLTKFVLKQGDFFISHSKSDKKDLLEIQPEAKCSVAVHPTYNAFKWSDMQKPEARKLLGISETKKVLLFFGFVRPYKGLKYLLEAMPEILQSVPDTELLVVGEFGKDREEYMQLIREKQVENAVTCYEGYIPDKEVEKFFVACDVVVLPYESATQSGIVQIAYGFEKPVIATRVGGLPEVVLDNKTGYVVGKENPIAIAAAVEKFFLDKKEDEFRENIKKEADKYSWSRMRETIERLVEW